MKENNYDFSYTKEIEETLNKIYEEREGNKIARDVAIRTEREGIIYVLTYVKDILQIYIPYFYDWSDWLKDLDLKPLLGQDVKLEQVLYKSVLEVEDTINILKDNGSITIFLDTLKNIKNSLQQLNVVINNFRELDYGGYLENSIELAILPVHNGLFMILNIINELEDIEL